MDVPVHLFAAVVAFVVAPPEPILEVLTRVVLHNVVPLLLHNLLLSDRRLVVELWLLSGRLCSLPGKLILVKQGAFAFFWVPLLFPGRATYVAKLSAASTGYGRAVNV